MIVIVRGILIRPYSLLDVNTPAPPPPRSGNTNATVIHCDSNHAHGNYHSDGSGNGDTGPPLLSS